MLVKPTKEKNGDISFNENLVNSIEFLRQIHVKFGKGAVAYVAWSADIDSDFYGLPKDFIDEQLMATCSIDKKIIESPIIISAIKEYKDFCLNTPEGIFLSGLIFQQVEIGAFMSKTKYTEETADIITKTIDKNYDLMTKIQSVRKTYQQREQELVRFMMSKDRKPTQREKRQMEEFIKNKIS